MRIAVLGAGAVGGYFGAVLARAGNPVVMIARGENLEAMRQHGLRVQSHWGKFEAPVLATDDPQAIGPVDLVLYCVKTYQNAEALRSLRPLVGYDTLVIPVQNGVDSYAEIAKGIDRDNVLPGAVYIEAARTGPGEIKQAGGVVRFVFGEKSGPSTPRCLPTTETFLEAGIEVQASQDMPKELWSKSLFITVLAGVTCAARTDLSTIMASEAGRETLLAALHEVEAVARAKSVNLDADIVPKTWEYMEGWAKDLKASMQIDMELGRPLELDALTGAVVRLGKETGVPTPVNDTLYAVLEPYKHGPPAL